jgi:hypothetical protein
VLDFTLEEQPSSVQTSREQRRSRAQGLRTMGTMRGRNWKKILRGVAQWVIGPLVGLYIFPYFYLWVFQAYYLEPVPYDPEENWFTLWLHAWKMIFTFSP